MRKCSIWTKGQPDRAAEHGNPQPRLVRTCDKGPRGAADLTAMAKVAGADAGPDPERAGLAGLGQEVAMAAIMDSRVLCRLVQYFGARLPSAL